MRRKLSSALLLLATPWAVTCGPSQVEDATDHSTRVENATFRLALATVPSPFAVQKNDSDSIDLVVADGDGQIRILATDQPAGVNLVEEVNVQAQVFQEREGGEFHGQLELGTPWGGGAFYARGSYPSETGRTEETWVYALHPSGEQNLVTFRYTYPAGTQEESSARVNDLLGLIGELEALKSSDGSAAAP